MSLKFDEAINKELDTSKTKCIGYIVNSCKEYFTVLLPEKPFGRLNMKFPQNGKHIIDSGCYDKYELKAFEVEVDENNNIINWRFTNISKCVEEHYVVALLADGRVLTDDCKAYKVWDSTKLHSDDWVSMYDWMFSKGTFSATNNIRAYIRNGVIYGADEGEAYKFRNSWSIEDKLAAYLNTYDRYYVQRYADGEFDTV